MSPDSLRMRKAFLLRIDPDVLDDLQRWANDDLRSLMRRSSAFCGAP